mmetsp:Transcript_4568/g.11038  ORF Transcript_4568/g.11038 Transcript_4568/m.11038 type:complete len:203 (-) Transcript_4568:104-712(-)
MVKVYEDKLPSLAPHTPADFAQCFTSRVKSRTRSSISAYAFSNLVLSIACLLFTDRSTANLSLNFTLRIGTRAQMFVTALNLGFAPKMRSSSRKTLAGSVGPSSPDALSGPTTCTKVASKSEKRVPKPLATLPNFSSFHWEPSFEISDRKHWTHSLITASSLSRTFKSASFSFMACFNSFCWTLHATCRLLRLTSAIGAVSF